MGRLISSSSLSPPSSFPSSSHSSSSPHLTRVSSFLLLLLILLLLVPSSTSQRSSQRRSSLHPSPPTPPSPSPTPSSPSPSDPQSDLSPLPSSPLSPPSSPSIYASQKKPTKHIHSPSEDIPLPSPSSDLSDDLPAGVASISTPSTPPSSPCLTPDALADAKAELKARLLQVIEQYLAVWKLEERDEDDILRLYEDKADELKRKLKVKKAELLDRACPTSSPRQLLSLEEDSWFDQEELPPVEEAGEEEDRGVIAGIVSARVVAGGKEGGEENESPLIDASIHPYSSFPSAFTEPSSRDIQSRHSPSPADDDFPGFIASISPARSASVSPSSSTDLRSQRERDEDWEEEKRKRRERLRALRAHNGGGAEASPPLTEEEIDSGQHFVASISPMAPQRSSMRFDEDEPFIGSIGPPPAGGVRRAEVVEKWNSEDRKESESRSREKLRKMAERLRGKGGESE